jgi:hypothetical protein
VSVSPAYLVGQWSFFDCFGQDVFGGVHNLNSDAVKLMLTNSTPSFANTVKSDLTEISTGSGYTGAVSVSIAASQSSGLLTLSATGPTFTWTGAVGPFQNGVLFNDTPGSKPLIAWCPITQITQANGETLPWTIGTIFTINFRGGA